MSSNPHEMPEFLQETPNPESKVSKFSPAALESGGVGSLIGCGHCDPVERDTQSDEPGLQRGGTDDPILPDRFAGGRGCPNDGQRHEHDRQLGKVL